MHCSVQYSRLHLLEQLGIKIEFITAIYQPEESNDLKIYVHKKHLKEFVSGTGVRHLYDHKGL